MELYDEIIIIAPAHERVAEKPPKKTIKKTVRTLRDVPMEVRKKQASEPLYLIRY